MQIWFIVMSESNEEKEWFSCVDCVRYDTDSVLCQYCIMHDKSLLLNQCRGDDKSLD